MIAQKDSILHPDNLLVEMLKPKKSNEYYWVVSGQDKKYVDYSGNPEDGWQTYPKKKDNTRYVNARTGSLLSYGKYELPDQ